MKKNKFVLFLFFIVCFACQGQMDDIELEDGDPDITACGKIEISENEYLIMQIVPALVSSESKNTAILDNQTSYLLSYGHSFTTEYFENNQWKLIPHDFNFPAVGLGLLAGETKENQTDYYSFVKKYNKGKKGRYRVIKEVSLFISNEYFPRYEWVGNYKLCAEFEII